MKRFISSLLLTFIIVMTFIPASANSVTIDSVNVSSSAVTINYKTDSLQEGDQVTVLTYAANSADVAPTEQNIKYIDQITKSSDTSLTFNFNETPSGTYQIKMGGTDVATPDVISITVDEKTTDGGLNFINNNFNLFSKKISKPESIIDYTGKTVILKPENNYIAAYADIPSLDGYVIDSYGIILNGTEYTANITTTNVNNYGVLFRGAGITDEYSVVAYPYIVYKNGDDTITYFGTTIVDSLNFASAE